MPTKYASQKDKRNYIFAPGGLNLGWQALLDTYPDDINKCYLVALDDREISVILDLLSITKWYWLWAIDKSDDAAKIAARDFTTNLEKCLMSGCDVQQLITSQRLLIGALTGADVDLDTDLPSSGVISFPDALAPRFSFNAQNIAQILDEGLDAINAQEGGAGGNLATIAAVLSTFLDGGMLQAILAIAALGETGVLDSLLSALTSLFSNDVSGTPYLEDILAIDTQDEITSVRDAILALADRVADDGQNVEATLDTGLLDAGGQAYLRHLEELSALQLLDDINRSIRSTGGGPGTGQPEEYIPDEWPDAEEYLSYKCLAANTIYDALEDLAIKMELEDWDALLQAGLSSTAGILATIIGAIIVGSLTGAIIPAAITFIIALAFSDILYDAGDVKSAIQGNKSDLIRALFNAQTVDEARDKFIEKAVGLSSAEEMLFRILLTDEVLEPLFTFVELNYDPPNPVTCEQDYIFAWKNGILSAGTAFMIVEDEIPVPAPPETIDNIASVKTLRMEASAPSTPVTILLRINYSPGGNAGGNSQDCTGGQGFWQEGAGDVEIVLERNWHVGCGYFEVVFDLVFGGGGVFSVSEAYIYS